MAAFIREGLTVAPTAPGGIKKNKGGLEMTVPEFAMPPDAVPGIAQVIVNAWNGDASLSNILDRTNPGPQGVATPTAVQQATAAINAAAPGYNLKRAVIIKEEEHDAGYTMQTEDDVIFVLPNPGRLKSLAGANLVQTAKLLMACTPNGI